MGMIIQNGKQYFPVYNDTEIKALPTVDTASGAIATFNTDLTENLVSVKCQIVAKQASGTPSPDNPLPITTYTEMNLSHCGKNLFDESYPSIGTLKYMSIFVGNGTFTMSTDLPTRTDTYANLFFLANQVSSGADSALNGVYNNRPVTVTSTDGYVTIAYRYDQYNPRDYHTQIEHGTTATTYEPYNATTANIPFGQTVANGVLDITTGKLRVTSGYIASYNGETINEPWVSSIDEYVPNTSPSTGAQVVYPLVTPYDIQLDSITLQALLNENSIWCDTGDTEVKFLLTVGKKIS